MKPTLEDLDLAFFRNHGFGDPAPKLREWFAFIGTPAHARDLAGDRGRKQAERRLIEIAVGVDRRTVRDWLGGNYPRVRQLTRLRLQTVARAIGMKPPRSLEEELGQTKGHHHPSHVALVIPPRLVSEAYFLAVSQSLHEAAAKRGLSVSIHHAPRRRFGQWMGQLALRFDPDGLVLLRIAPRFDSLQQLTLYRKPIVLIHADRLSYDPPVLTNIVPDQSRIGPQIFEWLRNTGCRAGDAGAGVVVASMRREVKPVRSPGIFGTARSIRNERIDSILAAVVEFNPTVVWVDDYGFHQALRVWQANQAATRYICLSDQLAVGLKHILVAAGNKWQDRIVGFDGSSLALQEGIPSFSQHLPQIGDLAIGSLCDCFQARTERFTAFHETKVNVHLVQPGCRSTAP
jgi:DNA-binding LacI/PurR family transcriptional regulator